MVINMKVIGFKMKELEMELLFGKMEISIQENGNKTKNVDKEFI